MDCISASTGTGLFTFYDSDDSTTTTTIPQGQATLVLPSLLYRGLSCPPAGHLQPASCWSCFASRESCVQQKPWLTGRTRKLGRVDTPTPFPRLLSVRAAPFLPQLPAPKRRNNHPPFLPQCFFVSVSPVLTPPFPSRPSMYSTAQYVQYVQYVPCALDMTSSHGGFTSLHLICLISAHHHIMSLTFVRFHELRIEIQNTMN